MKGFFGDYLRQNMRCRDADLQLTVFKIEKAVDLFLRVRRPLPVLHFMLQGNILCRLRGFGKVLLTEGFSHLFYVPSGEKHSARLAPGTHCSFHIDDSRQFLQKLAAGHPECREVLESVAGRSPKGVRQHRARITLPVRALIDDIVRCPAEEPDRTLFLETKIRKLLLLYVNDLPQEAVLLKPQVRQLEEIRDYLLTHLDEPHTIPSLAKRFHLSETTLRRCFQQYFGEPVHHFLGT